MDHRGLRSAAACGPFHSSDDRHDLTGITAWRNHHGYVHTGSRKTELKDQTCPSQFESSHVTQKGAEAFVADATDAGALTKAFSGAKAAYAMIPPNMGAPNVRVYQERVNDALVSAIENNGLKYAVVLSSFGADKPEKTGPVIGLHTLEEKLNEIPGLNALYLRAGYFMENILPQVGVIKSFGDMAGPVKEDLPLPMIATRDIGAVAADALLKLDFEGKRPRELQGAGDVSYVEVARIVGAAIGKPDLTYKQMPAEQLQPALLHMGMSSSMAGLC
jgi:uncharacterized protein YbjT (DUF2867 family)